MRGNTWVLLGEWGRGYRGTSERQLMPVLLGEWGRGYRGTSERQHMGTTGGMGAGLQRH